MHGQKKEDIFPENCPIGVDKRMPILYNASMTNNNTKENEMLRVRNNWTDVVCNWAILIMVIIPLMSVAMIGFLAFIVWTLGV